MARVSWKFIYFSKSIWRMITRIKQNKKIFSNKEDRFFKKYKYSKKIIYERSSSIPFCLKRFWIKIHKGRGYRQLIINGYSVGHKFGEFGYTRKPFHFPVRKKKGKQIRR